MPGIVAGAVGIAIEPLGILPILSMQQPGFGIGSMPGLASECGAQATPIKMLSAAKEVVMLRKNDGVMVVWST